ARGQFQPFCANNLLPAVLNLEEELPVGLGFERIGLALEANLDLAPRPQFLIGKLNADVRAPRLPQPAKELPPKPIELLRVGFFRQPPTPEVLKTQHSRLSRAITL